MVPIMPITVRVDEEIGSDLQDAGIYSLEETGKVENVSGQADSVASDDKEQGRTEDTASEKGDGIIATFSLATQVSSNCSSTSKTRDSGHSKSQSFDSKM